MWEFIGNFISTPRTPSSYTTGTVPVLTVQGPYVCLVWGFVWRIGSFGHEGVTQRRVPRSFRGSWGAGTHTGRGHTVKAFASSQVSTQEANKSKHREYGTTERERERFCAIGRRLESRPRHTRRTEHGAPDDPAALKQPGPTKSYTKSKSAPAPGIANRNRGRTATGRNPA